MAATPPDKGKALELALAQIDKQYGKGSVMRLGDESRPPVEVIPTGSISLDVALGIGGLPRGRIVEIYGPESSGKTSVALHAVASAQRLGGTAAFIDAEHALDPEYAKIIGVDTDSLLVSQPDTGEQALEIADMLIRSGALDAIVIDSVAALVPRAEIEGEMGDSHVGLQARLMSQALRKLTSALYNAKTTAIFINQLREKVGVMFGCMDYSTRVTLADGSQELIGEIVHQKKDVEVLSYDPETDRVVPRKVVNWFNNGPAEEFLQFTVASGNDERARFATTANHLIRTPGGWREAGELVVGDRVLSSEEHVLGDQQWQVVLGSLLGDGGLIAEEGGVRLRMGGTRASYVDWKAGLLGNVAHSREGEVGAEFAPLPELRELHEAVYFGDGRKHLSWDFLKALDPMALAVWYMDSCSAGSEHAELSLTGLSEGSQDRLVRYLRDTYGFEVELTDRRELRFSAESTIEFQVLITPYVPSSMRHTLLPGYRDACTVEPRFAPPEQRLVPARVLDIQVKPESSGTDRFDIEVEGNHNYFVDGVMVHNSPETTTGGKALKFYSSVRLDVRRIETLKDGSEPVGNRTRVKVVKNKVAPPFKQAEFDIIYGVGISREGSLIDMGVEQGIIRKSGAWYTYEGDQLGQGKENARKFMRENPDVANEIEKRIKEKLGIGASVDSDGSDPAPVEF